MPGKVQGFTGLERDRVAGLGVGVAGQDRPAFRDDGEDRAESANVEINPLYSLLLKLDGFLSRNLSNFSP
jgi:hypothetical protein